MTTIAVTGAAGQLGRYVIAKLKEKIAPSDIVAIVRNTSKSKNLDVAVRQAIIPIQLPWIPRCRG